jgi:hypothetical protein
VAGEAESAGRLGIAVKPWTLSLALGVPVRAGEVTTMNPPSAVLVAADCATHGVKGVVLGLQLAVGVLGRAQLGCVCDWNLESYSAAGFAGEKFHSHPDYAQGG